MKERIKKLLGAGVPQGVVATSVGCSPSYISQLMEDSHFAEEVALARVGNMTALTDRDSRIDKLEDAAIERLEELLPYATKPMELTRIFQTLNAAKRRSAGAVADLPQANQVIQLNIPIQVVSNFQLSERREVVEVNGRTMVSMSAKQLQELAANHTKELPNANTNRETKDAANDRTTRFSIAASLT